MIKKFVGGLSLILSLFIGMQSVMAQKIKVSETMYFAGVKLQLSKSLQAELKKEAEQLHRGGVYFDQKLQRIYAYMPVIEEVMKEEGLPEDFKYLPIQESSLIGDAVSSSNAVGFWQFKKPTALEVGMRVDGSVDERMSITGATKGAANYLKKHNRYLDNWVHTLLSYYAGLGGVKRHINNKYKGAKSMKVDTKLHWYVKKTLAHKIAFESYLENIPPQKYYLKTYNRGSGKTMRQVAYELKIDEDILKDYNLWLKKGRVPTGKTYTFVYPIEGPSRALDRLSPAYAHNDGNVPAEIKDYPAWRRVGDRVKKINGIRGIVAQRGEDISDLANIGKVSEIKFIKYNDIPAHRLVHEGEIFYFKRKKRKAPKGVDFHIAQYGETMWDVAQHYGIKLKSLLKKNRMHEFDPLKPGRKLFLRDTRASRQAIEYVEVEEPQKQSPQAKQEWKPLPAAEEKSAGREAEKEYNPPKTEEVVVEQVPEEKPQSSPKKVSRSEPEPSASTSAYHIVVKGETYYGISRKYQLSVEDLLALNGLAENAPLSIGQQLKVKNGGVTAKPKLISSDKIHKVQKGETMYKISKQYGVSVEDILKWNNKKDASLSIGEELKILNSLAQ
ncbi:lytic transglycosylase domain-containing protein [Persicobacter sp. CCB-QB2]|uniref:LysM peptidoglycan-binding domain-containing protein n=1 Tax=Persicobacter sp. CCB-QB2 TaxID=1561025 RepID=UPI0006A9EA51|nr:lytic transglycosylase domain-containing protein [Persicobacter sp. CCB-QB2]